MRYDTIIIGGGLTGLTAGIALVRAQRRVAILAKGLSRLNLNSGSLDLLGYDPEGNEVEKPLDAIARLDVSHPYRLIAGEADLGQLAAQARQLLSEAGVNTHGEATANHYRMTPIGTLKPSWLTLEGYARYESRKLPWRSVTVANIKGYLDFPADFVAGNLRERGVTARTVDIAVPELERHRYTPSEMRSTAIATVLSRKSVIPSLAGLINSNSAGSEAVLMPALVGLDDEQALSALRSLVNKPLELVATMPPSVGGTRLHTQLRKHFIALGGTFVLGSTVTAGSIANGRVTGLRAKNFPDQVIAADNYLLASGSLSSGGIVASYERVYEPVFDLDVNCVTGREQWNLASVYDDQPYMRFGVVADGHLRAVKDGKPIGNLRVAGSVLAGNNAVRLASEGGVAMLTALHAVNQLLADK